MGRIVEDDGSMPAEDFPLVDAPGAQMIIVDLASES